MLCRHFSSARITSVAKLYNTTQGPKAARKFFELNGDYGNPASTSTVSTSVVVTLTCLSRVRCLLPSFLIRGGSREIERVRRWHRHWLRIRLASCGNPFTMISMEPCRAKRVRYIDEQGKEHIDPPERVQKVHRLLRQLEHNVEEDEPSSSTDKLSEGVAKADTEDAEASTSAEPCVEFSLAYS
eukprot:4726820-Pyramimonas_sp.AAC.3